jgi:class 3 adenylate cyclase
VRCGANPPGNKFCGQCAAAVAKVSEPRFGSPESYTPSHLAEKILTSNAALEGERKQVTVLFADLKGSMELLADRDPEEARRLLDPVLERMMEAVHHYEGTVNQVMGDGIMAPFGKGFPIDCAFDSALAFRPLVCRAWLAEGGDALAPISDNSSTLVDPPAAETA